MLRKKTIVINKKDAENVRRHLLKVGLLDKGYHPLRTGSLVYFPLNELSLVHLDQLQVPYFLTETFLREIPKSPLESLLTELKGVYNRKPEIKIERVGDLVLLSITDNFISHKREIIDAITQTYNIQGIFEKISEVQGLHRVPTIRHLSGSKTPLTTHIEYGIKIYVDLEQAYFNPRLANEHNRVASLVSDSELILDMFTGVGPYPLHIAKKITLGSRNMVKGNRSKIIAVDINPTAIRCLKRSIKLNKLKGLIYPIIADSTLIFSKGIKFDRIIMNLPHAAYQYLPLVTLYLQTGGIIHFYTFSRENDPLSVEVTKFNSITKNQFRVLSTSILKAVAPRKVVVRIDASKK